MHFLISLINNQVHISEARVSTALDKLAYMEELVSDKLLNERAVVESDRAAAPSTSSSINSSDASKLKTSRKGLNVSGPVKSYHPRLKNFWYPVAFSNGLKDDTMVIFQEHSEHLSITFRVALVNNISSSYV